MPETDVDIAGVIDEMVDRIVREFSPLQVILFGSFARGDARRDSDIDLLVVMPAVDHKRNTTIAMLDLLSDMPVAKDVVVTTPDEIACRGDLLGTVLRPALREGRTLYDARAGGRRLAVDALRR